MEITITDAELILMRLLWRDSPLNARQIAQGLESETGWHRKTVNTLLSRLEKKLVLSAHKQADGINYFTPLVAEDAYMQSATSKFVDRLFGGDIAPLIASFAGGRPLNTQQINRLRDLLKELSDDN